MKTETPSESPQFVVDAELIMNEHLHPYVDSEGRGTLGMSSVYNNIGEAARQINRESETAESTDVNDVREYMATLDENQADRLNRVLNSAPQSKWLRNSLVHATTARRHERRRDRNAAFDYVGALTVTNEDGRYRVADDTFMNFLEWHQYGMVDLQKTIDEEKEALDTRFINRVERAIARGDAPEWLARRLRDRLSSADLFVDDGTLTDITDGRAGYAERYDSGQATVIRHDVLATAAQPKEKVYVHEAIHQTDGYDVEQGDRRGLTRLFATSGYGDENWGPVGFNEMIVEHLADVLYKNGRGMDVTNPIHRQRRGATYGNERWLLETLCHGGERPIDPRLFVAAHFCHDETDTYEGEPPLECLRGEIEAAFPDMNVLSRIEDVKESGDMRGFVEGLRRERGLPSITSLEARFERRRKVAAGMSIVAAAGIGLASTGGALYAGYEWVMGYDDGGSSSKSDWHQDTPRTGYAPSGVVISPEQYPLGDRQSGGYEVTVPSEEVVAPGE